VVVKVGVANFLDQSIGIDGTNKFQLKFFKHKNCGRHRFGRKLWASQIFAVCGR